MNDTQDLFFSKDFNAELSSLGKQKTELDFDQINAEKEYFFNDYISKEKSAKYFIGEMDESTEISALLSPLNSSISGLKRSQVSEENTETEEILAILRKKSSPTVVQSNNYSRFLSKSSPQFYEAKKIPMKGRVLEFNIREIKNDVGSQITVSNFSLPVHSPVPVRPKCLPKRSITDGQGLRYFSKNEFINDLEGSKCEKFNL